MAEPEKMAFTTEQQEAYDAASVVLREPSSFLAPIPSLVSVCLPHELPSDDNNSETTTSTNTTTASSPVRGHHELYRALDRLEGLDKEELTLVTKTPLTRQLTELIACDDITYEDSSQAMQALETLGQEVPRRVCQHPFKKNDIVWVCRTCQADETCVLCHACFSQSQHEGHDVAFYHAQAGGCCDCGDPDAWDPAGFCPRHGPDAVSAASDDSQPSAVQIDLVNRVRGVVPSCVDWMVRTVANNADVAYQRANNPVPNPPPRPEETSSSSKHQPAAAAAMEDMDLEMDEHEVIGENFPLPSVHPARAHVFSPSAASSSSSSISEDKARSGAATAAAEQLGVAGTQGHGLYIVLHADDIHSSQQLLDALRDFLDSSTYYTDTLLGKLIRALRLYGQLVVWGTAELVKECGATQVDLWMDGDKLATARIGATILERANKLIAHGMFCSILTRDELILEQRAVAVLQWVSAVAKSCDPLCLTVAESILPNRHLVPLLRADFKMSARVTKSWYSLLLTLLAVPTFKSHLAAAYCDTYRAVTAKYARGMGVLERSGYTLSVQFLNRVTYVIDLVQGRDLLGKLGKSLLETLRVATLENSVGKRLDPNHFVLTHRRYSPCVSDLKCVLNVSGMPRVMAANDGSFLQDWISALSLAQFMDTQVWRYWGHGHVEDESRGWVGAFNASISLGSLFERLLGWSDNEMSPIQVGPLSQNLKSCVELTYHILVTGIDPWQQSESQRYQPPTYDQSREEYDRSPASLPFSTIAALHGSDTAMRQLSVSQASPFSFHLPLHRFVAGCLRELCLRDTSIDGGVADLLERLRSTLAKDQYATLFQGLLEYPALVLSRAAQIRAGLWRRNGAGLNDQVLNYAEPPFCRNMRDADLLMTQFATIGTTYESDDSRSSSDIGIANMLNLMFHRFGLFEFCGLQTAPSVYSGRYADELLRGLYSPENSMDGSEEGRPLPWTYSPSRDSATSMLLLEEFLHFTIVFIVELPPVVPLDKAEQTHQAKSRLFREVVHRLSSGPKTHSELSEVHHVLSYWDNVLLSEEGKLVNPDDATGAALGTVLADVANRKISRTKMEPDKWELLSSTWNAYDPAFFHVSLKSHETAAEFRPKPSKNRESAFGWEAKAYAPSPSAAHPFFERLRRDTTSDITVLAVVYRVLHIHCRSNLQKDVTGLRGKSSYENNEKSETVLARAIHLITLGAYAWQDANLNDKSWRQKGGGSGGSMFFDRKKTDASPTINCWIKAFLMADPSVLLNCSWYEGEESAIILLHRLAVSGGIDGGFIAQDAAVRAGAAWLCEFCLKFSSEASVLIRPNPKSTSENLAVAKKQSDVEMRKKLAKEKAMARMKAQAAKFASVMDVDLGSEEDSTRHPSTGQTPSSPETRRKGSFGSNTSSVSGKSTSEGDLGALPTVVAVGDSDEDEPNVPPRLLKCRPRCIICNYEDSMESSRSSTTDDGEGQRKKSRRRTENALGFVGYVQPSTVMKGGGGPPPQLDSKMSHTREFVGTHVALCGHAVHSECCDSYLATVSQREDRQIGKRDEFRCPMCQRLSNCLVPFIDASVDWLYCPSSAAAAPDTPNADRMQLDSPTPIASQSSLHTFLSATPWWITKRGSGIQWDGQSAFVEISTPSLKPDGEKVRKIRRIRSPKKKELYAAWNAMMRTPRFVRRRLRRQSSRSPPSESDSTPASIGEDSMGETVVWRRLIDQIADISYRADSKRLGDEHLHDLFGEFRHYIVEKHAYNTASRFTGAEQTDWPSCLFGDAITDSRKQEMSREKLLSKLLLSVQAFTYSCSSEAFEARRAYRKCLFSSNDGSKSSQESLFESLCSKFGMRSVTCGGKMIVLPSPSAEEGSEGWPFNGRLGKLRYLGLSVMAAAGAVSADLVQLVLPFPITSKELDPPAGDAENPDRAPVAYPLLYGNVLTHVVAAMCAACGRARARSDSLDVVWPVPFSSQGGFASDFTSSTERGDEDSAIEDCEGFLKLGMLARMLQVLLGSLDVDLSTFENPGSWIASLRQQLRPTESSDILAASRETDWIECCLKLLELAFATQHDDLVIVKVDVVSFAELEDACLLASTAATNFLCEAGTILQILLPGAATRLCFADSPAFEADSELCFDALDKAIACLKLESLSTMLTSPLVGDIVSNWLNSARENAKIVTGSDVSNKLALKCRLNKTQQFRVQDWPSAGSVEDGSLGTASAEKKVAVIAQPQDDSSTPTGPIAIASPPIQRGQATSTEIFRSAGSPMLLSFNSKKSVSLLGGYSTFLPTKDSNDCPRILVIPTSYTDLYAELGCLMPECEQTAVCLICGEVLNANGKGECTRHSYKCGAGAGMFFLLQECSGLIMHKSKASYIHSPYVDSHGETPQYRGRPLNLDLDRYEHLREVWFSHGVRQKVVQERGSSRQVIVPDFY